MNEGDEQAKLIDASLKPTLKLKTTILTYALNWNI